MKQQLEQLIEKAAETYCKKFDPELEDSLNEMAAFRACGKFLLPVLLRAVEQRDEGDMLYAKQVVPAALMAEETESIKTRQNKELLELLEGEL